MSNGQKQVFKKKSVDHGGEKKLYNLQSNKSASVFFHLKLVPMAHYSQT